MHFYILCFSRSSNWLFCSHINRMLKHGLKAYAPHAVYLRRRSAGGASIRERVSIIG